MTHPQLHFTTHYDLDFKSKLKSEEQESWSRMLKIGLETSGNLAEAESGIRCVKLL